jgi:hypothetical protein
MIKAIKPCLQVILAGDFYQLPPVPTPAYGDDGSSITSSPLMEYFHVQRLSQIHRQSEVDLITAIHEARYFLYHHKFSQMVTDA